jgi:hypothetical protein
MSIDWHNYTIVCFIDSNIALECLALEQLPWGEIHKSSSILVLVTPAVLKEVESKKSHSRLGDHARRFNRTLLPLIGESSTVAIRCETPRVELALADCEPIEWGKYPELDADEPDSRIVGQALTARGPSPDCRLLISQDIRPLQLAKRCGLKAHHIGENWLRPKEKSEFEKKASALQRELAEIKKREPKLILSLKANKDLVRMQRVSNLSAQEREAIYSKLIQLQPMDQQAHYKTGAGSSLNLYDHSLSGRYDHWKEEVVPRFVSEYERKLELNFGQVELVVRIDNVGQVQAESLLVRLAVQGGWFNDRYVIANPHGPAPPQARLPNHFMHQGLQTIASRSMHPPGKHEFVVHDLPKRSTEIQISCSDFRHGYDYEYRVICWADPHSTEFAIDATVTATNLYGDLKETLAIERAVAESSVFDLLDSESLEFRQLPELIEMLLATSGEDTSGRFELDSASLGG